MFSSLLAASATLGGLILLTALPVYYQTMRSKRRLPPGPTSLLPFIGNAHVFATKHPWKKFRDWSTRYGPIVHFQAFGHPIVILNSANAAFDLLDGRSAKYSDRPNVGLIALLDISWVVPLMQYGERWRKHRRVLHKYCSKAATKSYEPTMVHKARQLLVRIRHEPSKWVEHSSFAVGTILLDLTYGLFDDKTGLRYFQLAQGTVEALTEMFLPGMLLVQYIPFLRHLPSWFPGASQKARLIHWHHEMAAALNEPFENVKAGVRTGKATPSFVTQMLDDISELEGEEYNDAEAIARNCAAVVHGAGSDTTIATLMAFFLAMVLHPDAQKKAHEELMSVVGPDRLPEFRDRPTLPYINAVVKECSRWVPLMPLGAFHSTTEDDVYEGYFIPKGTTVFANQWAMLYNPDEYPDPESFKPERFLKDGEIDPSVRDPGTVANGFGRRICPGKDISDATIFICVASLLHVFEIRPYVDDTGCVVWPKVDVSSLLVAPPLPFKCNIVPRSDSLAQLIDAAGIVM